jgi:HEAT repeat protein
LRGDTAEALRAGLRYLTTTEDSLLRPDNIRWEPSVLPAGMLLDRLDDGSPSERVALLWELAQRKAATPDTAAAVAQMLLDRCAGIRAEAARTLGALAVAAAAFVPNLVETLDDGDAEVRGAAAYALGKLGMQAETVVPVLAEHLEDRHDYAAATAALAVARFGPAAGPALPAVLAALKNTLMVNRYPVMDWLLHAVRAIAPEPQATIDALVESCDAELRQQAPGVLAECRPIDASRDGPGAWFGWFRD